MKLKALIGLIIAAAVVIVVTTLMMKRDSATWQTVEVGGLLFEGLPVNDVGEIHITKGEESLTLVKKDDKWVVKERSEYPASFEDIGNLALALEELKPLRVIEAGKSQFGRLNLLPSSEENGGTQLELKNASGKVLASLLLGKPYVRQSETQRNPMMGSADVPEGRYILVGNAAPVYLVAETFENVAPSPATWLEKDFFKVERLSSVSVQFMGDAAIDWEFTRESLGADFQLTGKAATETVDNSKTRSLSSVFTYSSFNDVLPTDTSAEITRLDKPTIAILKTFDGFVYTLNIGRLTGDETGRYLTIKVDATLPAERVATTDEKEADKARLDAEFQRNLERLQTKLEKEKTFENWVYIIPKWSVENLLKNRINWMKEPDPNAPTAPTVPNASEADEDVPAMLERPADELPPADVDQGEPEEDPADLDSEPAPTVLDDDIVVLEDELDPNGTGDNGDGGDGEPEP